MHSERVKIITDTFLFCFHLKLIHLCLNGNNIVMRFIIDSTEIEIEFINNLYKF